MCANFQFIKMAMQNLETMTNEEFRKFLNSFDNILTDCDGVLWTILKPIEGIPETFAELRKIGKKIRFVSNNGTFGIQGMHDRMEGFKYNSHIDDITIPTLAVIDHLKKINFNKEIYVFGTDLMKKDLTNAGFKVMKNEVEVVEGSVEALLQKVEENKAIGAVVFDVDFNLSYLSIQKALVHLKRPDVHFIIGSADRLIPFTADTILLGPGHFQTLLSQLSKREPITFGKPSQNLNEFIMERYQIGDPKRTLFIGDSLDSDMGFASISGYQKLLVLTGVATLEDAKQTADTPLYPDYYIKSLGDLGSLITKKMNGLNSTKTPKKA